MRIFVAGAAGALGRVLVARLTAERHDVRADPRVDDLRDLVRGCDAVVDLTTSVDADATRRLLAAAIAGRVRRYVQQSYVTVYRDGGDRWLDEDAPLHESAQRSVACLSVIEREAMIRLIDPQALPWTILRAGSFVGAGTSQDALIARLRTCGAVVSGDGSNYLSPLNVADMASAVAAALRFAPSGSTFNIVDEPLRYADYIDALADLVGVTRPPRAAARPLPESRRCSSAAARTVLGWMPRHPIWPARRAASELVSSSSGWT